MEITRRILFENERLQIGHFEARFVSDTRFDVEREEGSDALVLPFSGVFSRHDGPGRYVVGTPSHAVLFTANTPYRIGFPGAIGDRALTLRFGQGLARERSGNHDDVTSHGLLSAKAILLRNLLRRRLETGAADAFEVETLALELVHLSLKSMRRNTQAVGLPALARRKRALERVKEAVAVAPSDKWSVAKLAKVANLSPFHLCHVFREIVGTSLYNYVLQERLAAALDEVLDGGEDITAIAMNAGFASHSHFTERFRRFFGYSPAALRNEQIASRYPRIPQDHDSAA